AVEEIEGGERQQPRYGDAGVRRNILHEPQAEEGIHVARQEREKPRPRADVRQYLAIEKAREVAPMKPGQAHQMLAFHEEDLRVHPVDAVIRYAKDDDDQGCEAKERAHPKLERGGLGPSTLRSSI